MSVLTKKWQTTIRKEIRRFLGLQPHESLLCDVEGEKVTPRPLRGDILGLRGTVHTHDKLLGSAVVRKITRRNVAKKIIEGSE